MKKFNDARDWFFERRFGWFIHWGIYAVGGRHEQELQRFRVPKATYLKYVDQFTADQFDPAAWLDLAQEIGAEYLVFTVKHHDGFCLWNTQETDFNVMNSGCHRDLLQELSDECHRRNFPLMLYYSVVDWNHPQYPNIGRTHEISTDPSKHDMPQYVNFVKRQLTELCSNYGKISGIWWDMNVTGYRDPSVNTLIRQLQPGCVINNRGFDEGDYSTPERDYQELPDAPFANPVEACNSVNVNSWGYCRKADYFTNYALKSQLAENLARGGNYLLNMAPDQHGIFAPEAVAHFRAVGQWYQKFRAQLTASPCPIGGENGRFICTGDGQTLNLIFHHPYDRLSVKLLTLHELPQQAVCLNTHRELPALLEQCLPPNEQENYLLIRNLPMDELAGEIPIIQLKFANKVVHTETQNAQVFIAGIQPLADEASPQNNATIQPNSGANLK